MIIILIFIFFYKNLLVLLIILIWFVKKLKFLTNSKLMKILFFTLKQWYYLEKIIKIYTHKQNISIFEVINKNGNYNFDEELITFIRKFVFLKNK